MTDSSAAAEKQMQEYLEIVLKTYDIVLDFFKGDEDKTNLWFTSDNLNFGGSSPQTLVEAGRVSKVLLFVENAAKENRPDRILENK